MRAGVAPEIHRLRIKVIAEESLLNRVYDICMGAGASMEQVEVQTGNGRDKMEIECTTSEAIRLAKSLVALRTASGLETISINLRNPSNDMALFPLFPQE